jgi:hypothetical protein
MAPQPSPGRYEKALTKSAQWRIPSDFLTLRRMQNTASSLMAEDNALSRIIRRMARTACGLPVVQEKRKAFSSSVKSAKFEGSTPPGVENLGRGAHRLMARRVFLEHIHLWCGPKLWDFCITKVIKINILFMKKSQGPI